MQVSDTDFDLRVVWKEGCVSSVNCAIILQSVLLCEEKGLVSQVFKVKHHSKHTGLLFSVDERFSYWNDVYGCLDSKLQPSIVCERSVLLFKSIKPTDQFFYDSNMDLLE